MGHGRLHEPQASERVILPLWTWVSHLRGQIVELSFLGFTRGFSSVSIGQNSVPVTQPLSGNSVQPSATEERGYLPAPPPPRTVPFSEPSHVTAQSPASCWRLLGLALAPSTIFSLRNSNEKLSPSVPRGGQSLLPSVQHIPMASFFLQSLSGTKHWVLRLAAQTVD